MDKNKKHDSVEDLRENYVYKPWPADDLIREARARKSGKIQEIPVPKEVFKRTAAQELADPPKFPLLKEDIGHQLLQQLKIITDKDKLIWTDSNSHVQFKENRVWYMQVSHFGLEIIIKDLDYLNQLARSRRLREEPGTGWLLRLFPNSIDNAKPDYPLEFYFRSDDPEVKDLTNSILKQANRGILRDRPLLDRIWNVLNLR